MGRDRSEAGLGEATRASLPRKVRFNKPGKTFAVSQGDVHALLRRDEPTGVIASMTRQHMYVVVGDGLAGADAAVLKDIQPRRVERIRYRTRYPLGVAHDTCELLRQEVQDRWRMALQDHEDVT